MVHTISTLEYFTRFQENSQFPKISHHCYSVAMEVVMSTKYTLKFSSMFCICFVYALKPKLRSIANEGVRPCKLGASLLNSCKNIFPMAFPVVQKLS